MLRFCLGLLAMALWVPFATAQVVTPPTELKDYVSKEDKSYTWKLKSKTEADAGTLYEIDLVSQTWQGIKWDHGVVVVVPKSAKPAKTMMLWNQGGSPSATNNLMATEIAKRVGYPCAFLYGIPKQPLYNGKREDALIAETFVKYLETGDGSWPLLFPMVKSVVKTMDCLQEFTKKEWNHEQEGFLITGASKRGWTSWLTAATGDKRVKAIAPLVIDTLNFQLQMPHQFESFGGAYSEQILDYKERKLLPLPETSEARKLWAMVDPWVYKDIITVPKMIINGTNDPYWAQDALNLYWDDLKGDKYICYVPNAGHDLRAMETPNVPNSKDAKRVDIFPNKAVNSLAAFTRSIVEAKPLPTLEWKYEDKNGGTTLLVDNTTKSKSATLWVNKSETKDFRKAKWVATPLAAVDTQGKERMFRYADTIKKPESGYVAILAEFNYETSGREHTQCTQIKILGGK